MTDQGNELVASVLRNVSEPLSVERVWTVPSGDLIACRVRAAGVCRTDISVADGTVIRELPIVLGHECVVDRSTRPGSADRAVVMPYPIDKYAGGPGEANLRYRAQIPVGRSLMDADGHRVNQFAQVGAFATDIFIDPRRLVPISSDVPDEIAAVLGCAVTTGVDAVFDTAEVQSAETVVVVGCGGVGLSAVMAARSVGARVIGVDVNASKESGALEMGADAFFVVPDSGIAELRERIGVPVSVVIEAAGTLESIPLSVGLASPGGRIVLIGSPPDQGEIRIPAASIVGNELRLIGHANLRANPTRSVARVVAQYLSGEFPLERLVDRVFALGEINAAFDAVREGTVRKAVIDPRSADPS